MKNIIRIVLLLAVVTTFVASSQADSADGRDMTTENRENVRKIYEQGINGGDLRLIDPFISEAYEGPEGGRGPAAFRANVASLRSAFPDIRFTIEDLIAEGDRVVVRWSWEATHDGPFRGIAPTHKRVTNSGIVIYRLQNGKVIQGWLEADRLGVLQQLGAVPTPARAKAN